jgi:acyl carrier protein
MVDDDVVRMVNEVFEQSFEIEPARLRPEAHIFKDLGLDSLDTVDLVVALQKKFGVRIQDGTEVRSIETLASVYDFIRAERAKLEG